MKLFPAIDIREGRVVRLQKGNFNAETHYGDDPVGVARSFEAGGAPWIHVVDLDAARTGKARNRVVVGAIAATVDIPVQTGGGVRDRNSAEALLEMGVGRIVLGTVATQDPGLVEFLALRYPGRIAVGVDARNGMVAVSGWEEKSDVTVSDVVKRFSNSGVAAFIITDIERDGMLQGPDVEGLSEALSMTHAEVVASGGVGSLDDLRVLNSIEVDGKKLSGVIVGKALYEQKFTLSEALRELG